MYWRLTERFRAGLLAPLWRLASSWLECILSDEIESMEARAVFVLRPLETVFEHQTHKRGKVF